MLRLLANRPPRLVRVIQIRNFRGRRNAVFEHAVYVLTRRTPLAFIEPRACTLAYCSSGGRNGKTMGVFKLGNAAKAGKVLGGTGNGAQRRKAERQAAPRSLVILSSGTATSMNQVPPSRTGLRSPDGRPAELPTPAAYFGLFQLEARP